MTSSTKPEIHNILHCRQKRTEPRPQVTPTEYFVKFRHVVFWATVCKTVRPMLSDRCLSVCPVCLSVTFVHCGQTVGRIKMKLGTQVGLGLRDIVFDMDPATLEKKAHPPHPIFCSCLLWPNGWMDENAAWYGSRLRLRPHCTRRGPSSRERSTAAPPSFRPMSIVATVAHLSYC